ncbi:MAG: FecR family protein [Desulfobacterales bacterium]|nr:FecR family protein [Desulfobacterales bacterium]
MDIKNQQKFDNENQENGKFLIPDEKDMQMTWDNVENLKNEYPKPDMSKMWENCIKAQLWTKGQKQFLSENIFFAMLAAILLPVMLLGIGIYYTIGKINTNKGLISYTSPEGLRTKVNLPDGSTIWLQPNSEIKYPKEFSKEKREIYFTGQAYFDIKHNTEWPLWFMLRIWILTFLAPSFMLRLNQTATLLKQD